MNSLKSLFFVAILAAAACGVYVTLNKNPEASLAKTDQSAVKIDMGTPMGPSAAPSAGNSAGNAVPDFPAQPPAMMPATLAANGYGSGSSLASPGNAASSLAPPSPYGPPPTTPQLSGQQSPGSTIALPPPPGTGSAPLPPPPFQPAEPLPGSPSMAGSQGATSSQAGSPGLPPLPASTADSSGSAMPAVASLSSSTTATPGGASSRPRDRHDYDSRVNPANFAEPSAASGFANGAGGSAADPRAFDLAGLKKQVDAKMNSKQYAEALTLLSLAYDNPDVSPNDETYVVKILDMLAGEVIYSRKHLLEEPYVVKANETLDTIADAHHVPALLLMRINGLRNPQSLAAGTTLKVVPGPFNAQISVRHMEMTLMLGGRYAGRFPVNLGSDPNRMIGMYTVRNKRSTVDTPVPSAEAAQGLGKPWIDLGDQTRSAHLNLQGAADLRLAGQGSGSGTVYVSDQDMDDIYGILSIGSSVVIQR